MKINTSKLFILLSYGLLNIAWADSRTDPHPYIDKIEYKNNMISIVGDNFGPPPIVIAFENFESPENNSSIQRPTQSPFKGETNNWQDGSFLITEGEKNTITNTARRANKSEGDISSPKAMAQLSIEFGAVYHEAFISYSVKVPQGKTFSGASKPREFPDISSWKFSWLMLGANGFQNSDFDICIPSHVGSGNFLIGGNDGNLTWLRNGKEWWDWDNYNHFSSHIAFNNKISPSEISYEFNISNSVTYYGTSGTAPTSRFNSKRFGFDRLQLPGWWGNGDLKNFEALYDNIYVAVGENSLARIVLSSKEMISDSDEVITVAANEWKNNQISIHPSAIPAGRHYYVHVYDRSGKKTTQERRICPGCPAPVM